MPFLCLLGYHRERIISRKYKLHHESTLISIKQITEQILLFALLILMYSRDVTYISEILFFLHFHFLYFLSTIFSYILPVPHYTPPSSGSYRCRHSYRRKRAGVQAEAGTASYQTVSVNLMPIHTIKWCLPILLN